MKDQRNQIESESKDDFCIESYTDSQALAKFINTYRDLLCSEPTKAYGVFKDILGKREDLAPGSREILSRTEWSYILDDKYEEVVVTLHLHRLRSWIVMTYSSTTALPWLETLSKFDHGSIDCDTVNNQGQISRPYPTDRSNRLKYGLIVAIGIIVLVSLKNLSGLNSQNSSQIARDKKEQNSNNRVTKRPVIETDQTLEDPAASLQAKPKGTYGNNQDYAQYTQNSERDSMDSNSIELSNKKPNYMYETSGAGQRSIDLNWERLKRRIDNGQLSNSDLSASSAENYLRHWVQSFELKPNSLTIVLRTNSEVDAKICKLVLAKYQEKYTNTNGRAPFVILQSSRYFGRTLSSGYLPACQLSPSGDFSRV